MIITTETTDNAPAQPTCPRCEMTVEAEAEFCKHCGAKIGPHRHVAWWHIHRRLFNWTLAWAYRPSASVALFILSFTESIIFPVPPDVLLIPLTMGNRKRWISYATNCTIASILGAMVAYLIGWLAWGFLEPYAFEWLAWTGFTPEHFEDATAKFEKYNFWIVFTAGFTPLPFKVFNVVAGTMGPNSPNPLLFFVVFSLAATTSRGARFFLLTGLIRKYGAKITPFIDKYFNWLALGFAVLLIGGIVIAKFVL